MSKDSGYTTKDMIHLVLQKLDQIDEKRIVENKRIYDKMDQLNKEFKDADAIQDNRLADMLEKINQQINDNTKSIEKNKQNVSLILKIFSTVGTALTGAVVGIGVKIIDFINKFGNH